MNGLIVTDGTAYYPIQDFTTADLGCARSDAAFTAIFKVDSDPETQALLENFNSVWQDPAQAQDVTDRVAESIAAVYQENSPEFIYFYTLYNIFSEFLEDISEDVLPNEATGFRDSAIWSKLYNFQKDAALAIINKLEKYNGCILADSVGLGKTFTALAVIKYYENRNKSVLVLCPKKLAENWNTYKGNYKNNPLVRDRLRYDVLFHTDLSRTNGTSNGIDLSRLNWGNYDLVVIDESHNFRNGGMTYGEEGKENRYLRLMNQVIRPGVKTKVLMLSATPVNNRTRRRSTISWIPPAPSMRSSGRRKKRSIRGAGSPKKSAPQTGCSPCWTLISSNCWTASPSPAPADTSRNITIPPPSGRFPSGCRPSPARRP